VDRKRDALRRQGVLNPRAEQVRDPLFQNHDFFDPLDLVQVKYEMVRRMEADHLSITDAADAFGFSRPSFYQARAALQASGLAGLLPQKRGPREGHKLSAEVVAFMGQELSEPNAELSAGDLAVRVERKFGIHVHPRSIERALERAKKKRR
jgi:transposase